MRTASWLRGHTAMRRRGPAGMRSRGRLACSRSGSGGYLRTSGARILEPPTVCDLWRWLQGCDCETTNFWVSVNGAVVVSYSMQIHAGSVLSNLHECSDEDCWDWGSVPRGPNSVCIKLAKGA